MLSLIDTVVSLIVKVLQKFISLVCFRVRLEVNVYKNPTSFSCWSVSWGHESENVDCIIAKENELEHCKSTYPKNIMLEFDGHTITAHGLGEHKKYVGEGDCFYSGRFDYELGCEIAIRNMFCQIAADQGFTGEAGYIDDANKIRIERFVDGYCVSNKSIEEQYYTVEAMEKDNFWHIVNRGE